MQPDGMTPDEPAREAGRLRAERDQYRAMVESSPSSVLVVQDGRYVFANPAGAARLGYDDPAELIGVDVLETLPEEVHENILERIAAVEAGERNPPMTTEIVARDGSRRWVETTAVPTTWEGRPAALVVGRDVTRERRSDDALHKSEERLRMVVEGTQDGIWDWVDTSDPDALWWSPRHFQLLGYDDGAFEPTMERFEQLLHPDDRATVMASGERFRRGDGPFDLEYRLRHRSGEYRWFRARGVALPRRDGGPGRMSGSIRDITAEKRLHDQLRGEKAQAQRYLDLAGVLFVALDAEGRVTMVNRRAQEVLGWNADELQGRDWFSTCLPERVRDEVRSQFEKLVAGDLAPVEYVENLVLTREGEERLVAWHNALFRYPEGSITGTLSSGEDITERRAAEEALQKSEALLDATGELARTGGWELDLENDSLYWTRATRRIFEVPDDYQPTLEDALTFYPGESGDRIAEAIRKAVEEGEPYELELDFVSATGRQLRTRAQGIPDMRDGRCRRLWGVFQDITERVRAQAALRQSEELLKATGEMARVGGWEIDVEQGTVTWTQATRRIHEVPDDYEPTLEEAVDFFPGDSRERISGEVRRAMELGEAYELELDFVTARGRTLRVRTRGMPEMEEGRCVRLWGTFQDITEQYRATTELQAAMQRTERILESISDGFFTLDRDLVVTYYNLAAERLLRRSREEVLGRGLFDVFPEARGSIFEEVYRRALRDGETRSFETYFDVEPLVNWYEVNVYPFKDGISVFFRVVTEQKRLEKALRESEERFRSIFTNAVVGIFQSTPEGALLEANPAFATMFGYESPDQMVAEVHDATTQLYADPEDRRRMRKRLATEGRVTNYEVRFKTREGDEFWASLNTQAIQDDRDGAERYEGTAVDVTERHMAVRELQESRALLQAAMDCSSAGIAIADAPDGRLRYVNRAGLLIRGGMREEVVDDVDIARYVASWKLYDVDGERPLEPDEVPLARALLHGERSDREFLIRRAEHDDRTVLASAAPILDAGGQVTAAMVVFLDITEQRHLEASLRDLAAELSAVEERERRELATFLHDRIGQTLAVLRMRFGDVARRLGEGEVGERVESMRDLLERAIEETQSLTFQLSPPILYELGLEPALEWVGEEVCGEHGLRFSFSDDGKRKPLEEDVAPLLYRSVRELLLNVVKHARATSVEVAVERAGDWIRITVADDGVGFDLDDVFVGATMTRFGLFSVRERLTAIGGSTVIESTPGGGTGVVLEAPLAAARESP